MISRRIFLGGGLTIAVAAPGSSILAEEAHPGLAPAMRPDLLLLQQELVPEAERAGLVELAGETCVTGVDFTPVLARLDRHWRWKDGAIAGITGLGLFMLVAQRARDFGQVSLFARTPHGAVSAGMLALALEERTRPALLAASLKPRDGERVLWAFAPRRVALA